MEEVGQMAAGLLSSFHILRRKKKMTPAGETMWLADLFLAL